MVNLSNLMDETRATRVEDCAEGGFSDTLAWLSEDFELANKSRDEMMRNAECARHELKYILNEMLPQVGQRSFR